MDLYNAAALHQKANKRMTGETATAKHSERSLGLVPSSCCLTPAVPYCHALAAATLGRPDISDLSPLALGPTLRLSCRSIPVAMATDRRRVGLSLSKRFRLAGTKSSSRKSWQDDDAPMRRPRAQRRPSATRRGRTNPRKGSPHRSRFPGTVLGREQGKIELLVLDLWRQGRARHSPPNSNHTILYGAVMDRLIAIAI